MCEQQVTWTWPFVWGQLQVQVLRQVRGRERVSLTHTDRGTCNKTRRNVKREKRCSCFVGKRTLYVKRILTGFWFSLQKLWPIWPSSSSAPVTNTTHKSALWHHRWFYKNMFLFTRFCISQAPSMHSYLITLFVFSACVSVLWCYQKVEWQTQNFSPAAFCTKWEWRKRQSQLFNKGETTVTSVLLNRFIMIHEVHSLCGAKKTFL